MALFNSILLEKCLLPFEKYMILVPYFVHKYIIIKYRSNLIKGKIHQLLGSSGPFLDFIFEKCLNRFFGVDFNIPIYIYGI